MATATHQTTAATWQAEAERLLRAIEPEAVGLPLYMVDMHEEIGAPAESTTVGGFCGSKLDMQLRERLRARGQWAGRGCAFTVNASQIVQQFKRFGHSGAERDARRKILAVCLHEFAHWLTFPPEQSESEENERIASDPAYSQWLSAASIEIPQDSGPIWYQHTGNEFGRAAIHLWHRANALCGYEFYPGEVWNPYYCYGLSPIGAYVYALGDEPAERLREPIRQVLASPAPVLFTGFCNFEMEDAEARLEKRIDRMVENHFRYERIVA